MLDTLFFVASKLFWMVARPEALLCLLIIVGALLLQTRQRRLGRRMVLVAAFFVFVLNIYPVWRPLMAPLEQAYTVAPDLAEAPAGIIVLGGAEVPGTTTAWDQPQVNSGGERFLEALALAHQFPEAKVIFTGGSGALSQNRSGSEIAEMIFLRAGLPPERLLFERDSRNTAENAAFLKTMLGEAAGPWILVTSAFHMPRSVATFCAAGWMDLVPWPVDFETGAGRSGFATNISNLNKASKEWIGMLAYRITGRAELPGEGCLAKAPDPVVLSEAARRD